MLFLMIFVYNHTVQKLGHNDYCLNLIIYVKTQKLYDKIYSRENGRIMRCFRVISRKGVVTDEMSLLPTHRHEGNRL